ncbi:MAG: helix-turn-helix transcriptional regulator [Candidatus Heimdallarchaeota archaeon]|nr:helix-turn-helix transcriptional regulator [Candidatus Heimdallarchaeota archaeon]
MTEDDQSYIELKIFSNNIRRELVRVIGESGSISFSSIKEELDLTDGRLYFHLKKIDPYIEKDNQNFYRLNEEGKRISFLLFHEKEALFTDKAEQEEDKTIGFVDRVAPSGIFYYFLGTKTRSMIELNIVLLVICWLFGLTEAYGLLSNSFRLESFFGGGAIVNTLLSIAHWYIYIGIIALILVILKTKFDFFELSIGVLIGTIPYLLYLIPVGIMFLVGTEIPEWGQILIRILYVLCKVWSTILIAQAITITSKRKWHESFIIASILMFLDYVYLFIQL